MRSPSALPYGIAFAAAIVAGVGYYAAVSAQEQPRLDVIYVPTPDEVVNRMVELAEVTPKDRVVDLGCGDGRMVVAAAKRGAHGLGVDINPERIKEANANAKEGGVTDLVEFRIGNLFEQDISDRDVILMYLLTDINIRLRPKILETMKPGSRVVSHAFGMGDWKPDVRESVAHRTINVWIVPARIGGQWAIDGDTPVTVDLKQTYQMLEGKSADGATVTGRLRGTEVTLTIEADGKTRELKGKVEGEGQDARIVGDGWSAKRA